MFGYVKTAFLQPWNLLIFLGGLGLAALSPSPDVAIPIVLAGEAAYLGFLGTHPKFQAYVKAQKAKAERAETSAQNTMILQRILKSLPRRLHDKYEGLKSRCRELQQIADDLQVPNQKQTPFKFETCQTAGLDRLLWVYIRLLFTQYSLERFFETISSDKLTSDIQRIQQQLGQLRPDDKSLQAEKIRHTLSDNLKTTQERLANFRSAESNYQYVILELDRLENKIKSLAEMSVNRQDAGFISAQIDAVADSMRDTEKTMNDLQFITGLGEVDDEVPNLMRTPNYVAQ